MASIPELQACPDYPFPLLPDGVHLCEEAAFRTHFVERFPESQTRQPICDGFFRLRAEVAGRGIIATQWVDGSFVEGKANPGDVDVVSFCDYDFLNNLDTQGQQIVVECLDGREATKATYQTHTFLVPSCPVGHSYHVVFEEARIYWRNWFGKTREVPDPPGPDRPGRLKGFVQMALGDASLAPVIATERGAS
ncbi:MAG TPA: hypothetical protein VH682_32945 [Gemmataceae bacterium]|jgi:hypothetical protein